jgi:hypothetical protein
MLQETGSLHEDCFPSRSQEATFQKHSRREASGAPA